MADLNETLSEESQKEEEPEKITKVKELKPVIEKPVTETKQQFPCDQCGRIFLKLQAKNLHMDNTHSKKTIRYTPFPIKRKVGRPQTRFLCEECNVKLIIESELSNHMTMVHNNHKKRTRSEKSKNQLKGACQQNLHQKRRIILT